MRDYDPRLVALYDADNPDGPDHDYFRGLADRTGAGSVVDLGCGTGLLTVTLVGSHRTVTGIDPSPAMLAYARKRPGAENVTWVAGDSRSMADPDVDLAVRSGNVAAHSGRGLARCLAAVGTGGHDPAPGWSLVRCSSQSVPVRINA